MAAFEVAYAIGELRARKAESRTEVDNTIPTAAIDYVTRDMLHQEHRCLQVHRVHDVPVQVFYLQRRLELSSDTGAVDKNLDPSEFLKHSRHRIRNPTRVGEIGHDG
jgi:hypothetical protein